MCVIYLWESNFVVWPHQGYWKTNATTKSMNNLMERNILDFGVGSVDVVAIMQDQSVSGHYGILEFYNNKVK